MSDIINQNTEPLFIFDMPDDETLSETISVKGEKGAKGDPTKLSQLDNDTGFITKDASNLTNYYDKTATDTKLDEKLDVADFNSYEIPTDFFTADNTVTGAGSNIELLNTARMQLGDIRLYGDTNQKTLTGKNLIYGQNYSSNGVSYTYNADTGEIRATGTPTNSWSFATSDMPMVLPAGTYTVSINGASTANIGVGITVNGTRTTYPIAAGSTSKTFTLSAESTKADIYLSGLTTGTAINLAFKLQLEASSSPTSFEPFCGAKASPNFTYPQDIETVTGEQTITITGDGTQTYTIDLGDLEICKLDDGKQDYIYKQGSQWYKHVAIGKANLGDFTWYQGATNVSSKKRMCADDLVGIIENPSSNAEKTGAICTHYTADTAGSTWKTKEGLSVQAEAPNLTGGVLHVYDDAYNTATSTADFKAAMQEAGAIIYYPLAEAEEQEITDSVLVAQLNELTKAESYEGGTAIAVSGTLPALLTVTAFKRGWSGTISGLRNEVDELGNRPATDSTLGLVKVGEGLDIAADGELSVTPDKKIHFHSVAASSATYILQMPNGKNMLIDTGQSAQWSDIKAAIDSLGITKFDYVINTHFHNDHCSNNENIIDTYDLSECTWWVGMKPDFANHAAQIPEETENGYDSKIAILQAKGIEPIVPTNNSTVVLDADNGVTVRFLNTDPTIAENYYTRYTEYRTYQGVNFNDFSLIAEITFGDVKILATGDIERPVEDQYASYLGKINIMTAPHHGVNQDANRAFYYATKPDYAICAYVTDSDTWVHPWYRSFAYLKEFGAKIISAHMSQPVDGLFSFTSDGKTVSTTALYSAISDDVFNYGKQCVNIADLVRATIDSKATITLDQMLDNLPEGSMLRTMWWSDYNTSYPQVYADLQAIFPTFKANMMVEFRKDQGIYELKAYNNLISFEAYKFAADTGTINWRISGHGNVGSIASKEALLTLIPRLPLGQYVCTSYKEPDSEILQADGAYALHIDIVEKDPKTSGIITAQIRDLGSATTNYVVSAQTYYRSDRSPYIFWRRTNNLVQ